MTPFKIFTIGLLFISGAMNLTGAKHMETTFDFGVAITSGLIALVLSIGLLLDW